MVYDDEKGHNPDWKYQPQSLLPDELDPNQKFVKSNGSVVHGRRLTGDDKPFDYGYMFCPDCRKTGFKNNHFKLRLNAKQLLTVLCYIDASASHAILPDRKSQGGACIGLGRGHMRSLHWHSWQCT